MNKNEKMKTINPTKFESKYGTIRAIREDDGILFIGVDVANAFGFGNTRPMAYCKNPTKRRVEIRDGNKLKCVTTGTCINPDDCMQLYYASKLNKADRDAVKAFIFESIIPTLNGTGDDSSELDDYDFEDCEEDRKYIDSGDYYRDAIKQIEDDIQFMSKQLIDLRLDLYRIKYRDWQDEPNSLRRFFMRYLSGTPDKDGKTMSERFAVDNRFLDSMVLAVESDSNLLERIANMTLRENGRKASL